MVKSDDIRSRFIGLLGRRYVMTLRAQWFAVDGVGLPASALSRGRDSQCSSHGGSGGSDSLYEYRRSTTSHHSCNRRRCCDAEFGCPLGNR